MFESKDPCLGRSRLPVHTAVVLTKRKWRQYKHDEDGSLLIFAVYIFVLILMMGGIGIDLMRFERDRAELQYTLDRAVLAAADLEQTLDPKLVVQDYFNKAGLGGYLKDVKVSEGLGYRVVEADASAEVDTQFMHMSGIDMLSAPATGTAEERIDSLEISLVLDVSGSMNRNSRLTNLKTAATEFVDTIAANTEAGKMSMSIVPYATQVSLPDGLMNRLNVQDPHDYSNCINFSASDFEETSVSITDPLDQTMHFDPWQRWDGRDDYGGPRLVGNPNTGTLPVCEYIASREAMVMQNDPVILKNYINALTARGNTSIDLGMKWGTALLDPSLRTTIGQMITDGDVPAVFNNRPYDYDNTEVLKVVVLMTDGQNTSQYYIRDEFRGQTNSDIWWNEQQQRYSVANSNETAWYWPHNDKWSNRPYGDDGWICIGNSTSNWSCQNRTISGSAERLTYDELWAYTTMRRAVDDFYDPWMNDSTAYSMYYSTPRRYVGSSTKNNRSYDICDAAKEEDIIVFTIGFEAPSSGRTVLRNCASSDAHYFDVDGLEISDAFASIATSIRKLRLTQ